ncbi:hypothetical protein D9M71_717860 [compost metagenome]
MSRPPVKAISPQPARKVINFGPKSRAGFIAKPVNGPMALPITAISRPISSGAMAPRGRPLLSSVRAMITAISTAVMIISTRKAWPVDSAGCGYVEKTEASSRLAWLPRIISWACS